jgi:coatomer protein complex subunit epsilon
MAEPDELYTLRAQYWLGHYNLALDEAKNASRKPMPPHLKNEREELVLRCYLGLKQYDKIITSVAAAAANDSASYAMKALSLHASYLLANDTNDTSKKEGILDSLKLLLMECPPGDTSVQLTACHIYLNANLLREALGCVYLGLTMEHLAMCTQIYIKIDRYDLAIETYGLLKQADEDSVLVQLTSVYIALAQGGSSKADDAIHTLLSLTEQYGPSLLLLNCTAVANIVGGKYDIADMALKDAISNYDGGSTDVDTLVNLIVCAQYLDKGTGKEVGEYIKTLKTISATHPYVQGLVQVEGAFDREANKYLTA